MITSTASVEIRKVGYACDFEVLDYYDRLFYFEVECDCEFSEDAYRFFADFARDLPVKDYKAGWVRPLYGVGVSK